MASKTSVSCVLSRARCLTLQAASLAKRARAVARRLPVVFVVAGGDGWDSSCDVRERRPHAATTAGLTALSACSLQRRWRRLFESAAMAAKRAVTNTAVTLWQARARARVAAAAATALRAPKRLPLGGGGGGDGSTWRAHCQRRRPAAAAG